MKADKVYIKWNSAQLAIEGNKPADMPADMEAYHPSYPTGKTAITTLSSMKHIACKTMSKIQQT